MASVGAQMPDNVSFGELACGLLGAVADIVQPRRKGLRMAGAADERRMSKTVRFIEAHFGEPLSLSRLASEANMSEFHFLRIFRQVTGLTPHQYLLRRRLREAAVRLVTGSETVLNIALASGFDDLSNFNRAFRAEFGMNPRAYRGLR